MQLQSPVLYGVRLGTLIASCSVVVALAVIDLALRGWMGRRARATQARGDQARRSAEDERYHWLTLASKALRQVVAPLTLLMWTYGLHFALQAPLGELGDATLRVRALAIMDWLQGALTVAALVWLLARIGRVIEIGAAELAARTASKWDDIVLPVAASAARLVLPLVAVILAVPALEVDGRYTALIQQGISIAVIAVLMALLMRLTNAAAQLVLSRHPVDVAENLRARAVRTQITVLRKVALAVIGLIGLASILMVFEPVRRLGATMLASAGVAGIIIGFAAQKSLATLLAGFQIALSQPIRVDDVVIVEGEWGRIEEITLTYVVVAIWDERRLVVPISYFIEQPFQNWTRTSSNILGTVMLYTDYSVPLGPLRAELQRLLDTTELWDKRVGLLQVTDAKERTLELRVLVSASDAGKAWDLRCYLREHLIGWLQRQQPQSLPRLRVMQSDTADDITDHA